MEIGKLKHKISIQRKTKTRTGMGSWTETWSEFIAPRAAIWPVSAGEQVNNQQLEHQITSRVRVRYQPGILSSMRILFNGRIMEIESIINVGEENRWLDFLCTDET